MKPAPGQIDAKVEIMNEKLTIVGTIMSSESYNYIIHVLLSATLLWASPKQIYNTILSLSDNMFDLLLYIQS